MDVVELQDLLYNLIPYLVTNADTHISLSNNRFLKIVYDKFILFLDKSLGAQNLINFQFQESYNAYEY